MIDEKRFKAPFKISYDDNTGQGSDILAWNDLEDSEGRTILNGCPFSDAMEKLDQIKEIEAAFAALYREREKE